jgi:hypothetical protein
MEDQDHISTVPAVEEAAGASLLKKAQQKRDDESRETALYLDIPSWGGDLVGKYKVQEQKELVKQARAVMSAAREGGNVDNVRLEADMNFILKANVGLYARDHSKDPGESGHEDLIEVGSGISDCGSILGKDFRNSHEALLYLFAKDDADPSVPITVHSQSIARWMRDPSKPVTDGVTGF